MKKTFQLSQIDKNPARTLEAIKHEVRKYIKRERAKPLPEGVDFWDFDCRFGADEATSQTVHLNDLTKQMDEIAAANGAQFYVEVLAKVGVRAAKEANASNDLPTD